MTSLCWWPAIPVVHRRLGCSVAMLNPSITPPTHMHAVWGEDTLFSTASPRTNSTTERFKTTQSPSVTVV